MFFTVSNSVWLRRHLLTIPPPWDQSWYLYLSLRYFHSLLEQGPVAMARDFVSLSSITAPLFPLTTVPLYALFGTSRLVAHLTNSVYLFLLLLGVYLLGKHLYGRRAALLAAVIVSTFTGIVNFSRDYLLEFPSAALVTLGAYALLRSECFGHRSWSAGFGVFVGLALLTKTMAGVFFVGPILYALGQLVRRRLVTARRAANVLISGGIAILLASVWWGPNFRTAVRYLTHFGFGAAAAPYSPVGSEFFTLRNVTYYLFQTVNFGASFLFAVLFLVLLVSRGVGSWRQTNGTSGDRTGGTGYLWVWFLVGYGILTAAPNKPGEKFALALLPPLALLLSAHIDALNPKWLRRSVAMVAIAIGAFNYVGLTYEARLIPRAVGVGPFAVIYHGYPHYEWIRSKLDPLADTRWPIAEILLVLADLGGRGGQAPTKVLVVPDHPVFNASTFKYYGEAYRVPLLFDGAMNRPRLERYAFVLVKSGGYQGYEFTTTYNEEIRLRVAGEDSGFVPLPHTFPFPDGSQIVIYAATRMFPGR
jgi:4-amino-4-deoxy-L-arabinose transferase-like glycosyltransferase